MTNANHPRILFLLAFVSLQVISCNNETSTEATPTDSAVVPSPDTVISVADTVRPLPDTSVTIIGPRDTTVVVPVIVPVKAKSATLGYSYFKEMNRGEMKDINVYVSVKNPASRVRDTLKVIIEEQHASPSSGDDTSVIYTVNVMVYETLHVSLVDPANDFRITAIHPEDTQVIDTVEGNRWRWTITTNTDKRSARLILKVIAEKPGGMKDRFDDKTIPINVKIDSNIIRRFFNYLTDNPAVSIPILVSLFGFLGWYIKRKMEKNTS